MYMCETESEHVSTNKQQATCAHPLSYSPHHPIQIPSYAIISPHNPSYSHHGYNGCTYQPSLLTHRLVLEGPGSLEGPPIDGDADTPSKAGPPITEQQAAFIAQHVTTNAEIRTLCGDLQVLGRSEFKQLLKWYVVMMVVVMLVVMVWCGGVS